MNEPEEELIVTGALIYGLYLVVGKPLMSLFGATPEEKEAIMSVDATPPPANPFSSQYQPYNDFVDSIGVFGTDSEGNTITDKTTYLQALKGEYDNLAQIPPLSWNPPTAIATAIAAEGIYNSFGFFKFKADYDTVNAVFNSFTSKQEVAGVSDYLATNYGTDLWTFLKNGSGGSFRGMKPADLAAIVNRVNALPAENQ